MIRDDKMDVKDNKEKRKYASREFPKMSLMDCIRLAESIKTNNNQMPYNRLSLAESLDTTPSSSGFRNLITYSTAYGLTTGSYIADKISLTNLGISIVANKTDEEKKDALKKALFNIPLFEKFFTKFNNSSLPKKDLLINTLNRDYDIPQPDCEACYNIIIKNARELGVLTEFKGNPYIQLDKLSSATSTIKAETSIADNASGVIEENILKPDLSQPPTPPPPQANLKVFFSHSKNKKILEQVKRVITSGGFTPIIAEEKETTAIAIADKVIGAMKECGSAIINFSVDEQSESDGAYELNDNVLIEIGAALMRYHKRIILLVDKRFSATLPSNLHGLYRCEYEGDTLSFDTAMKLQEALNEFKKVDSEET